MTQNIDKPERDRPVEVTPEMTEAGAVFLYDQLWKLDPFVKPIPLAALKLVVPRLFQVMAAEAFRK